MKILQKSKFVIGGLHSWVFDHARPEDRPGSIIQPAIVDLDSIKWSALPKDAADAERINAKLSEWEKTIASAPGDQWAATEGARL